MTLLSCNEHPNKDKPCDITNLMGGYVLFDGFKKIDKVIFKDFQNNINTSKYLSSNIDIHENNILRLKIDKRTSKIIEKNCYVVINDSLTYTIKDVKFKKIERFGTWGSVGFFCDLNEYKLNDSIINNKQTIVVKY